MPDAFVKTSIISILKNRNDDVSARNKYRAIAIVTAMSKIFELCLSRIMDDYLFTSNNRFGFKRKHSTDLPLYVITIIIIVLYILVFSMHLRPLTELTSRQCSKS